ncbi:alpha/beta fold hydrolase [Tautonia sp. JC769]|uniref:alpha/beta fold hydrolase n=1 Tax=Tautonia sp. JC769 TaxID=3232135 RepID=UPI00345AA0D5
MPELLLDGRNLYHDDQGARDGAPLVFLPGLGGDHRAFAVAIRHFAKRFRVLGLDHRDAGRSDRDPGGYSVANLADDAAAVLSALDLGPAIVVGQSMGGLIAQELALRHPERVRALVLASSHAGTDTWRRVLLQSWIDLRRKCEPAEFTRLVMPWLVGPAFLEHAAQVDGLIRFAERNEFPQDADAYARQARAALEHEARDRLGRIQVPTLVLVGDRDLVNPPEKSAELARLIPGARLVELPEAGHLPHIEAGLTFRKSIEAFVESL